MQETECTALSTIGFVPLTKGYVAIVDANDLLMLTCMSWRVLSSGGTVYATNSNSQGMHRCIMNAETHDRLDHINGNGLDNRRANLRHATAAENARNRRKRTRTTRSQYKGVTRCCKSWVAHISVNRTPMQIGRYQTEIEAVLAYDACAIALHGEFACLNLPDWAQSKPGVPVCHPDATKLLQQIEGKSKDGILEVIRQKQRERHQRQWHVMQEAKRRRREQWEADAPTRHHNRKRKYPWMKLSVGESFFVSDDVKVNTILKYANDAFYPRQFTRVDTPGGWLVKRLDDAAGPKLTRFQQACRLLGITNGT